MRNTKRKCSLIIAVVFVLASTGTGQEAKSFLSVQDILSGWKSNYGELKSMKVSYSVEIVSAEPSQRDPNITNNLVKWIYLEKVEEGKKFRARSSAARVRPSASEKSFADINSIEEMAFDGIHQKRYLPAQKTGQIYAGLVQKSTGTDNLLKHYLLAEPYTTSQPSKDNEEPKFSRMISNGLTDPNLMISVRPDLERISGQMCHVLKIFRKDEITAADFIWVAHERGMLPMKFQESGLGRVVHEITVEQVDFAKTENGGLWFPKKAFEVWNLPESLGVIKYEFNVLEFVPDIKTDPNTFQLDFPNGTQVGDTELGLSYTVGVK